MCSIGGMGHQRFIWVRAKFILLGLPGRTGKCVNVREPHRRAPIFLTRGSRKLFFFSILTRGSRKLNWAGARLSAEPLGRFGDILHRVALTVNSSLEVRTAAGGGVIVEGQIPIAPVKARAKSKAKGS